MGASFSSNIPLEGYRDNNFHVIAVKGVSLWYMCVTQSCTENNRQQSATAVVGGSPTGPRKGFWGQRVNYHHIPRE